MFAHSEYRRYRRYSRAAGSPTALLLVAITVAAVAAQHLTHTGQPATAHSNGPSHRSSPPTH